MKRLFFSALIVTLVLTPFALGSHAELPDLPSEGMPQEIDRHAPTAGSLFSSAALLDAERVLITAIVDGDTLLGEFSDGAERQIRLLGIDTPEVTTASYEEQCFGAEATAAVSMALRAGRYVYVSSDPTNRDEDDFGRKLRYVYVPLEGLPLQYGDLSEHLIAEGFAKVFREYPSVKKALYLKHEKQAELAERGLWGAC